MTPDQLHFARQGSKETDLSKAKQLLDELCHAVDGEHEENRQSRCDCVEDCTEHPKAPPM
jgi:hypothetical protein